MKELPEDIRPIVRFCYLTGWRIGEVLTLPWRQVDLKAGIVRLEPGSTKNDEGRTFPVTWVAWFNSHRLLEPIGYVPPAEFEAAYYRNQPTIAMAAGVN